MAARPLIRWPWSTKSNRALRAMDTSTMYSVVSPHFKDYASYLKAYKEVPFVRPCVSVIAYNAANVRFKLVPKDSDPDEQGQQALTSSPLLDLLERPNAYQTGFELREAMFTDLELTGNCFISLEGIDGRGRPSELYRLRPDAVTVLPDPTKIVAGYRYSANGRMVHYDPDEMWHLRYPHPFDDLYGMGTIEAMEDRANSARSLAKHEANFWASGAKITGVLSTDDTMDEPMWQRFKGTLKSYFTDSGFSTLLLEKGLKYQPTSGGPAQLGLLEVAKMSRDEILAMFGVPPTKVGILENANYKANASDEFFWQETEYPKLTRFEYSVQPLVDRFEPGYALRFERVNFEDDAQMAINAELMSRTFCMTVNELRQYQGKEPVAQGDVILIAGRGAPVAFDPATGEATVLGGPTPGEVTVDENGNVVPTIAVASPAALPPATASTSVSENMPAIALGVPQTTPKRAKGRNTAPPAPKAS